MLGRSFFLKVFDYTQNIVKISIQMFEEYEHMYLQSVSSEVYFWKLIAYLNQIFFYRSEYNLANIIYKENPYLSYVDSQFQYFRICDEICSKQPFHIYNLFICHMFMFLLYQCIKEAAVTLFKIRNSATQRLSIHLIPLEHPQIRENNANASHYFRSILLFFSQHIENK